MVYGIEVGVDRGNSRRSKSFVWCGSIGSAADDRARKLAWLSLSSNVLTSNAPCCGAA
jgi:hypothetical protein